MGGEIHRYLADDHRRLDALLARAMADPENIDAAAYAGFRTGLLKHIGMEEKVLLPAAQKGAGTPLPLAARLRLDHGALAALLVPSPTKAIVAAIRAILERHNPIEEDEGGIYDQAGRAAGAETGEVLSRLKNFPDVKVLPHVDSDFVMEAARRAVARAGYDLEV
ncbi:MAG TPA: hemerythrin domain-containing protein [Candidatus Binatia bacterium]|nr:hemerythrin domain-containing protein [Candidatus Binatia bacterium]